MTVSFLGTQTRLQKQGGKKMAKRKHTGNSSDIVAFPIPPKPDDLRFSDRDIMYIICSVTARRVMLPPTHGLRNQSVSRQRSNLAMSVEETDDHLQYINLYYDYEFDPKLCFSVWKVMSHGFQNGVLSHYVKFRSAFYTDEGVPYLEKDSPHVINNLIGTESKDDDPILPEKAATARERMFDAMTEGDIAQKNINTIKITQLLFARHVKKATKIVSTWDTEFHRIGIHGVSGGGHPDMDWDYITHLHEDYGSQKLPVDDGELKAAALVVAQYGSFG